MNFYDRLVVVFLHHLFDLFNVFCPMSMPKSMKIFFKYCNNLPNLFERLFRQEISFRFNLLLYNFSTFSNRGKKLSSGFEPVFVFTQPETDFQLFPAQEHYQRILTYHMVRFPCIDQLCHLSFSCLELHTF